MFLLFQITDSTAVVEKAFQIDPTNIYQFLVGGLVVIIFALIGAIVYLQRRLIDREKRMEELTVNVTTVAVNCTSVLESLVSSVDKLPGAIEKHKGEIVNAILASENSIMRIVGVINQKK